MRQVFVHTSPSSVENSSKAVMIAPLDGSKLEANIRCCWDNKSFFSILLNQWTKILSTYVCIFENWRETGKLFSRMFWNFDITLYVTKQCALFYIVQ